MISVTSKQASRSVARRLSRPSLVQCCHISRPSSSQSSSSSPHPGYLTTERKRKLISLYHSAENFVSPENLSNYIDTRFKPSPVTAMDGGRFEDSRHKLEYELLERRAGQKVVALADKAEDNRLSERGVGWGKEEKMRDHRLKAALYGVDVSLKPGLETVEEYTGKRRSKPRSPPQDGSSPL